MRYLTVREGARKLRAAGVPTSERQLLHWARAADGRDIWIVGEHVFIYEGEIQAFIAEQAARTPSVH